MDHSQWAMSMNPAFYANTPNANVDWASLAQQWIHMRETLPTDQLSSFPDAPPPPSISLLGHPTINYKQDDVKGEADMEVEKDEDDIIPNFDSSLPLIPPQPPIIPQWNTGMWRNPAWQVYDVAPPVVQSQPPPAVLAKPPPLCPELQNYTTRRFGGTRSPPPAMVRENFNQGSQEEPDNDTEVETLDAAKRKTLPAWIREGLEKMEREKQREEERIKMEAERKKRDEEKRKFEAEVLHELESTKVLRSKFDLENSDEESQTEAESVPVSPKNVPPTRSPSPLPNKISGPVVIKNRELQMQELMMSVRKNLTEILLEVTNEEIKSIARETHTKMKSKVNRAQTLRKTALTSITGGLGLGIYGSESESSEDDEKSDQEENSSAVDSEAEIRETMKFKKAQFERIAEEIEEYLEREELAELTRKREWERKYGVDPSQSRPNSDDSDDDSSDEDSAAKKPSNPKNSNNKYKSNESVKRNPDMGEPQHSSDYNSRSGARHKARVSRFSDPRDKVNAAELAAQAARLQKTEVNKKVSHDDAHGAATSSSNNVRLDLNQFLRREVSKDMVELLKQVKRARSHDDDNSSTTSSTQHPKKSSKKHKKHSSSKKSRRRSSSSSSSSSSSRSSSSTSHRKHKKNKKSSSKKDKKHRSRSRSRSRSSHRSSGKSYSRDRYRDRR